MTEKSLGVKDALVILGVAYYMRGRLKDLKSAYKRNKPFMNAKAFVVMTMMINSKNPVAVLEAGIEETEKLSFTEANKTIPAKEQI